MRKLLLALLAGVLVAPAAHAFSLPWSPVSFTVRTPVAGDEYRYEWRGTGIDGPDVSPTEQPAVTFVTIEGSRTGMNAFAVPTTGESEIVQQFAPNGTRTSAERCYAYPGSGQAFEWEILDGAWYGSSFDWHNAIATVTTSQGQAQERFREAVHYANGSCDARTGLEGIRLTQGDTRALADVYGGGWDDAKASGLLSAPSRATSFDGHDALAYDFNITPLVLPWAGSMTETVVFADGLPGPVDIEFRISWPASSAGCGACANGSYARGMDVEGRLAAFVPGSGAALAPVSSGSAVPAPESPDGAPASFDGIHLDDGALHLAYPYADAFAALSTDPALGFQSWLSSHPHAYLVSAQYDRGKRSGGINDASTDGGWNLYFQDGSAAFAASTIRWNGESTPLGVAVPLPTKITRNSGSAMETRAVGNVSPIPASRLASSSMMAGVAGREGLGGNVGLFRFTNGVDTAGYLNPARFMISDVDLESVNSTRNGTIVQMDGASGALDSVAEVQTRYSSTGLLPAALGSQGALGPSSRTDAALPALPASGVGLAAVGGLTILALLAVGARVFLFPLYTRLRKARLLDNPTRARIYEGIRAAPGLTTAEVVDLAGVGEGASRHHLQHLTRGGLLLEIREQGYVRYFAANEVPADLARRESVLRAGSNRAVHELLSREPNLSLREAGARLKLSAPSVHRAVSKLRRAGLLPGKSGQAAEAVATSDGRTQRLP